MLFLFVALCLQVPAQDKQLSLNDFFVKGTFRTEGVYGLRSMNDGEHYTVVEGNGARIVKYSYKTGLPVATLLDLSQIEDCPVKYLNDYTFNADESHLPAFVYGGLLYLRFQEQGSEAPVRGREAASGNILT